MILFLAMPLLGMTSGGSGCGGIRVPDSDVAVTRTIGKARAEIVLGPARVIINASTFTRETEVTLRLLPPDGSGDLVGPLFELSAEEPFPQQALQREAVTFEVYIDPPADAANQTGVHDRIIKLAYQRDGQWFGFNDGGSAFDPAKNVVRGQVRDFDKQPFRIAPVRRCGKAEDCSSGMCINATVCQ